MKKPYFSVIIPTLNEEHYLPNLLEDLASQKCRNFEAIVVDAKSDDDTVKVAEEYTDFLPAFRIILSPKRNLRYQRNLGVRKAKGEYMVLLEADVRLPDLFLDKIYKVVSKEDIPILTTWYTSDSTRIIDRLFIAISNVLIEIALVINKPFSGGFNTIVKKDIFQKLNGFREEIVISDDHDFTTRAFQAGYKLKILKEPQIIYSLRRFRSQGRIKVAYQYFIATMHFLLFGPISDKQFSYPMGGHVHAIED